MKRKVSNPLALAVMTYLTTRPMHPYELVKTLRDNNDARSVKFTPGSVYMVIEQLDRAGFVQEHETSRSGAYPERTTYALTDDGRAEWRSWLGALIRDPQHEYPQFALALSLLAGLPPEEVVALLRERRDRLVDTRAETDRAIRAAKDSGLHELFLVDEEFRVTLLDAETAFVDHLIDQIEAPEGDWAGPWAAELARLASERAEEATSDAQD